MEQCRAEYSREKSNGIKTSVAKSGLVWSNLERSTAPFADPHHCALGVQRGVTLAAVQELGVARVHAQHHMQVLLDARHEKLVGSAERA